MRDLKIGKDVISLTEEEWNLLLVRFDRKNFERKKSVIHGSIYKSPTGCICRFHDSCKTCPFYAHGGAISCSRRLLRWVKELELDYLSIILVDEEAIFFGKKGLNIAKRIHDILVKLPYRKETRSEEAISARRQRNSLRHGRLAQAT